MNYSNLKKIPVKIFYIVNYLNLKMIFPWMISFIMNFMKMIFPMMFFFIMTKMNFTTMKIIFKYYFYLILFINYP